VVLPKRYVRVPAARHPCTSCYDGQRVSPVQYRNRGTSRTEAAYADDPDPDAFNDAFEKAATAAWEEAIARVMVLLGEPALQRAVGSAMRRSPAMRCTVVDAYGERHERCSDRTRRCLQYRCQVDSVNRSFGAHRTARARQTGHERSAVL
jgi:hypothetical protein